MLRYLAFPYLVTMLCLNAFAFGWDVVYECNEKPPSANPPWEVREGNDGLGSVVPDPEVPGNNLLFINDDVLALADWLLEQRSYDDAVTEYKRFIFFNPEGERAAYAFHKMGQAYRLEHRWEEAVDALKASILATEDPRIADERRIVLATTLIASGNYSLARLELLKVSDMPLRPRSLYFYGIASLYMSDWKEAREAFAEFYSRYADGQMTDRAEEIEHVLVNVETSYKSARLARFLSTIMPGLGQMYAGDWRDGLNALVLNGLAIGFIANAIHRKDYRDATLISSISIRYYTGNIYNAEVDARKYNRSLGRESAMEILQLVRSDEPL